MEMSSDTSKFGH